MATSLTPWNPAQWARIVRKARDIKQADTDLQRADCPMPTVTRAVRDMDTRKMQRIANRILAGLQ